MSLIASLAGGEGDSESARDVSVHWLRYFFIAAVAISLGVGIALARNRAPHREEGWFSSPAYNLAHHGFFGTTVAESQGSGLTRIEQRTYSPVPLYPLGEALWYKLAPSTIFWTRAFSLFVWYPIALACFWLFVARLRLGSGVGPLAAGLLAANFAFLDNAALARPEMMCCALCFAGLAAFLAWREAHFYGALLAANFLTAAAILTDFSGIVYVLGLLAIVLWLDRPRFSWRAIAVAALPYVILGAAWGSYIARDPHAFGHQFLATATDGRWTDLLDPMAILKDELLRRLDALWPLLRERLSDPILITPFYVALLAVSIAWLWRNLPRLRLIFMVAMAALLMIGPIILLESAKHPYQDPQRAAMAFVLAHAKPDDRICGSAALLYQLNFDPRLRDDPYLGLRSGRVPDVIVVETTYRDAWAKAHVRDMQRIRELLSIYRLVYNDAGYEVYLLPEL